jgi:hypothetical protein
LKKRRGALKSAKKQPERKIHLLSVAFGIINVVVTVFRQVSMAAQMSRDEMLQLQMIWMLLIFIIQLRIEIYRYLSFQNRFQSGE